MDIIGLVPAAGLGTRLSPLPCSKELYPIGFTSHAGHDHPHPKVVSHYLLDLYKLAGAQKVYFILREGKWDIPAYFKDGSSVGLDIAYLVMQRPYGTPFTLDQAYPFVQENEVLFGFPDILVQPEDVFVQLLQRQHESQAAITLGTFTIQANQKWDILEVGPGGEVLSVTETKTDSAHTLGWAVACWGPLFTKFMHEYLIEQHEHMVLTDTFKEIRVGEVIQAAISNGLAVQSVYFSAGKCLDIGTPGNLRQAVKALS